MHTTTTRIEALIEALRTQQQSLMQSPAYDPHFDPDVEDCDEKKLDVYGHLRDISCKLAYLYDIPTNISPDGIETLLREQVQAYEDLMFTEMEDEEYYNAEFAIMRRLEVASHLLGLPHDHAAHVMGLLDLYHMSEELGVKKLNNPEEVDEAYEALQQWLRGETTLVNNIR